MRVCEAIFGVERTKRTDDLLVRMTGHPCPCAEGGACQLLPRDQVAERLNRLDVAQL